MKVGDTIWLQPIHNAARGNKELREATVTKVGNKYIYVTKGFNSEYKLRKDTLTEDCGQYMPNYQGWRAKEEFDNMIEFFKKKADVINAVNKCKDLEVMRSLHKQLIP